VVVERRSVVAPSPGGAGVAAPRGGIGGCRASSGGERRGDDLVIVPPGMAALIVPDQPLGEGRGVAQAVAGLDRGEAALAAGCERTVIAPGAVAGDGAIIDRGGEPTRQGVG